MKKNIGLILDDWYNLGDEREDIINELNELSQVLNELEFDVVIDNIMNGYLDLYTNRYVREEK